MATKVKKLRLRCVCDLCRQLKARTPNCKHQSCYYFPENMRVGDLPADLQLEINPKR